MKPALKIVCFGLLGICLLVTSPLMTVAVIRSSPVPDTALAETEPDSTPELSTEPPTELPTEPETEPLELIESDASYFEDALFIGDAHIGQLRQFGTLKADYLCGAGLTTRMLLDGEPMEGTTLWEKLDSKPYGKIYLMVGFHETADGTDAFRSNLSAVVDSIRQAQPDAFLFLLANQYLTKTAALSDPLHDSSVLRPFNAVMADLADGQQVFYLDSNSLFDDGYGYLAEDASPDGAHLKETLYPELCSWLCQHTAVKPEPETEILTFGEALEALRQGQKAARQGWEADVWLFLEKDEMRQHTADGVQRWTPGQDDLLADDWTIAG